MDHHIGVVGDDVGSGVALRSRPPQPRDPEDRGDRGDRDPEGDRGRVRAVAAALQRALGTYEPLLTRLQVVLVWERPVQCVLLYAVVNAVFW